MMVEFEFSIMDLIFPILLLIGSVFLVRNCKIWWDRWFGERLNREIECDFIEELSENALSNGIGDEVALSVLEDMQLEEEVDRKAFS